MTLSLPIVADVVTPDSAPAASDLESLRLAFSRPPTIYLNTAGAGLPPDRAVTALTAATASWQAGAIDDGALDDSVARARRAFATIVETSTDQVGISSHVSTISGLVAASLPEGARILAVEEDFTSVLFPFLALARRGRLDVTLVPIDRLLDALTGDYTLVAASAVQSADGRVLDLERLADQAARHRVRTFVDITQAAGWRAVGAARFDVTACGAFKWLCCPRGAAFITVAPSAREWLIPLSAGWYAGEDPWDSIYGSPLRLAADARAYQTAPAWLVWPAAAAALERLAAVDPATIGEHNVGLVNALRSRLGLAPGDSAILSLAATGAGPALAAAGVTAAQRHGATRLSFHLYNDLGDVESVLAALSPIHGRPAAII